MLFNKRPVICWATIDWHFLFQRHQHLMLGLAKAGHPVYFRDVTQVPGAAPEKVAPNLWVYRDFARLPQPLLENALYFIYNPAYANWITAKENKFIIYDCVDDFPDFNEHEALMFSLADLILCSSEALFMQHRGKHPHLVLLRNGVDVEHFSKKSGPNPAQIQQMQTTTHTIGFIGAMYPEWVDIDLLYYLAHACPQWHIVIVGESYGWDFANAPINLSYLGRKPYRDLPRYLHSLDAAIIPFLDNQVSRGADPIKLYEYLAAGLPVVSRDLPFVSSLTPPLVYRYQTREECISAINRALADNQKLKEARKLRLAYASRHTWSSRIHQLLDKLRQVTWLETTPPSRALTPGLSQPPRGNFQAIKVSRNVIRINKPPS